MHFGLNLLSNATWESTELGLFDGTIGRYGLSDVSVYGDEGVFISEEFR